MFWRETLISPNQNFKKFFFIARDNMKKDQINNLDSIDKAIFQILVAYRCVEGKHI